MEDEKNGMMRRKWGFVESREISESRIRFGGGGSGRTRRSPIGRCRKNGRKAAVATLFDYAVYEERQFTMERSEYEKKWKWK
jgi:hypothetical protein